MRKEMDNLIWFTIKNYRNIVGAYLEVIAIPKFLNLYKEKFKLDLRLLLLNLIIEADKKPLASIITTEKFKTHIRVKHRNYWILRYATNYQKFKFVLKSQLNKVFRSKSLV